MAADFMAADPHELSFNVKTKGGSFGLVCGMFFGRKVLKTLQKIEKSKFDFFRKIITPKQKIGFEWLMMP